MKNKLKPIGLLLTMITFLVIPIHVGAENNEFDRYYFNDGTFYKYTASSLEEYFFFTMEETKLAHVDWKKINTKVLALKEENHPVEVGKEKVEEVAQATEPPKESVQEEKKTKRQTPQKNQTPNKATLSQAEFEQEVIRLTNLERDKHGFKPLKLDESLANVARKKSVDMATNNYFSHDSPTYGSPFAMMESLGIKYYSAGENIARGQTTPSEVVQAWMDSEGHRENILHPDFTHIGVGFEVDGYYWTQQFIKRLDTTVSQSTYEQQVVELTNQERAKHGLALLSIDSELAKVARAKSKDMAEHGYFDHTSPTYGTPFDMMDEFGVTYQTAGENIARGQFTPEEVVQAWMNSEGHRANILNPSYTHIGVGFVKEEIIWTQQFIGK